MPSLVHHREDTRDAVPENAILQKGSFGLTACEQATDLVHFANGKAESQIILLMQVLQ